MFFSKGDAPIHGGPSIAELAAFGLTPGDVVDFSVNVNPYGPSDAMVEAVRRAPLRAYPDPASTRGREALARTLTPARTAEEIVVGSGATELFWSIARALLARDECVVVAAPCFAEFPAAAAAVGARVVAVASTPARAFDVDIDEVAHAARANDATIVHLGTPSSPVGRSVSPAAIAALAHAAPRAHIVLDESFLALSDRHRDLDATLPDSVIRVRSLTKDHAIAGLRAGYLLASPAIARRIAAARPSWTTSTLTEAAVVATTTDAEHAFVRDCRERLLADSRALARALTGVGLAPVPSVAPYLVVPLPAGLTAAHLRRRLLPRALLIRDCASFGLPNYVRLAARPAADRARLVAALSEELPSC